MRAASIFFAASPLQGTEDKGRKNPLPQGKKSKERRFMFLHFTLFHLAKERKTRYRSIKFQAARRKDLPPRRPSFKPITLSFKSSAHSNQSPFHPDRSQIYSCRFPILFKIIALPRKQSSFKQAGGSLRSVQTLTIFATKNPSKFSSGQTVSVPGSPGKSGSLKSSGSEMGSIRQSGGSAARKTSSFSCFSTEQVE